METIQQEYLNNSLERGVEFEQLVRSKSYVFIQNFIKSMIEDFCVRAIDGKGFTTIEEYREAKGQVSGLKRLVSFIENDIRVLENERKQKQTTVR